MIEKKLYSDQIIEVIKDDLLRGALKPGDRIKEAQLAERLGISRAPVREALSLLEKFFTTATDAFDFRGNPIMQIRLSKEDYVRYKSQYEKLCISQTM